ncbi:dihydrolipoyl dehydrogenase [Thermoproteota archaeon]
MIESETKQIIQRPTSDSYDVAVIGGGPGGYTSAIRAAQLKAKVILIEEKKLGGICTNIGCIPTKTVLNQLEIISEIKNTDILRIQSNDFDIDIPKLMLKKNEVMTKLRQGIEFLLASNGVQTIFGRGILSSNNQVEIIQRDNHKRIIDAAKIIVATGSKTINPSIEGLEPTDILSYENALDFTEVPLKILIVGGCPEGIELACIYSKIGSTVTIVETKPYILPKEDNEIRQYIQRKIMKEGITIETNTEITNIKKSNKNKQIQVKLQGKENLIDTEKILFASDRIPNIQSLGLEKIGVKIIDGKIFVNEKMETNINGIYAIGDVNGGAYAHNAMHEGIIAADNALRKEESNSKMNLLMIPRCIFTTPQVAAVGLTEDEAIKQGFKIKVGRFYFAANARALTTDHSDGLVKIVFDADLEEILGVHIVGPNASELIAEATLAMKLEATAEDITETIHAHPTLSEAIREAVMDANGQSIHKFKRVQTS